MKHLLPERKQYFKAALHCHSTISDGKIDPLRVKEAYKKKGYQILSLTDHEMCFAHPELNDENFLTLNGYEMMIYEDTARMNARTYHINFISKSPENRWQHYHPNLRPYMEGHEDELVFDAAEERVYSVEEANRRIAQANEKGFFAVYNHPVWSLQDGRDYLDLKGLWGVEVFNYGAYYNGCEEDMSQCYHELLRMGNCLCPVAADDSHKLRDIGGGFVMIGAEELTYESVVKAMEAGDLYASAGPKIHSLTLEGDTLRVTCTKAANIAYLTNGRENKRAIGTKNKPLTEAKFDLKKWREGIVEEWQDKAFFRLCITDLNGRKAWTRAYYLKDLA